jgi:hypothetical protein
LKSNNVEFLQYCGGHFENGDWKKFSDVGNQFRTLKSNNVEIPISSKFDMWVDNDVPN